MSRKLLSISADAKTVKGEKLGYLTGVLYLAPHTISGYQVCPKATEGCMMGCLYTAGRGIYNKTQQSRIAKTKLFFQKRDEFMELLVYDIKRLIRKAIREGLTPVVRLNGTSDLPWEKFPVVRDGVQYDNIMDAFPMVNFYDYTAILGRKRALEQSNYFLTFSLKENNDAEAIKALEQGYNVAVVMNTKRTEAKPATWGGYPVIDGDETDLRLIDDVNHIVALFPKGQARFDKTGFVRPKDGAFNA